MADISKTVAVIFEAINNTGAGLGGVSSGLDAIGSNGQEAAAKVNQLDNEVDSLSKRGAGLDTVIAGFKALATAIVVKEFIDANVAAERFDRAMVSIKGSTEAAALEFEYIKALSNTLGLSVTEAADAYVLLSAATKGTALEGEATREIYEAVSIAMSSLGRSTDDTRGALYAISQIVSKGCHAPGTLIRYADGSSRVVDGIAVGDLLMGPDGIGRTVIELAHGTEDMFRITPMRGEPFVVNRSHKLRLFTGTEVETVMLRDHLLHSREAGHCLMLNGEPVPFTVDPVGHGEYFGFVLSGDRLYLDAQGFEHHNTVSMEELRGQLGERLPGAFQLAAQSMGLTTQQLDELVSSGNLAATEFLPKFAQALKDTYGDVTYIEGFTQSMNRLQNALQDAYQQIGNTGAFDAITKGVQIATAAVTGAISGITALGEIIGAVAGALTTGDFGGLGEAVDAAMTKAALKTEGARNALLGLNEQIKTSGESATAAGGAISDGMDKGTQSTKVTKESAKELDAVLKTLGLDKAKFEEPLEAILAAFLKLANNPAVTGTQFLSGFLVTLDKIKDGPDGMKSIEQAVIGLDAAQKAGKLTVSEYTAALQALGHKTSGNWNTIEKSTEATKKNTDALKKQEEATKKAEEAAEKMRLEIEKLASNERIAQINAAMGIAVAGIEADAKKAVAAFDSIGKGIESTGKLLGDLYKSYDNYDQMSWQQIRTIQDAIRQEQQFRKEQFELQKELIKAQIDEMRARTESFKTGGGLIKIDGAGLQPHLEAFMWEILKTIQVRVNRDGLGLLLGTP